MNYGFTPIGATVNLTVSGATQTLALTKAGAGDTVLRLSNLGTLVTFVTFGDSTITTSASVGMPIPINGVVYVSVGQTVTHVAAIGRVRVLCCTPLLASAGFMADVRSTVTTPIASDFAIGAAVDNAGTPIVIYRVAEIAYFLNASDAVTPISGGGGGAPTNAEYLVGALSGGLPAERIVTDTATLTWDLATAGQAKANVISAPSTRAVGVTFDGSGSPITALSKADVRVPYAGTITAVTMLADQAGSMVIDIWKDTYAAFPPTGADSITAAAKPTITADDQSVDTTLVGWTTAITANDCLRFNVDSCATITRCTLILTIAA